MRRIVTRGLYTHMEGISSSRNFTESAEQRESPDEREPKRLLVEHRGLEHRSGLSRASIEEVGFRLRFAALHQAICHRKQLHSS